MFIAELLMLTWSHDQFAPKTLTDNWVFSMPRSKPNLLTFNALDFSANLAGA